MEADELRRTLVEVLVDVAPELDAKGLRPDVPLRDQMDLDSMDWLNVFENLRRALGIEVPESDYGRLQTLDAMLAYFAQRLP